MDLTPQSSRSSASPFRYTQTPQPLYEYPSPAQSDSRYRSSDSLPALGIYSCPMPGSQGEQSEVLHAQCPTSTNSWQAASLDHHISPRVSQANAGGITTEYDPFASFHPPVTTSYSHDIYATQSAGLAALPVSPIPSGNSSQRSSFSSAPESEVFTQGSSIDSYTPHIKMEDHSQYISGGDGVIMSSPQIAHNMLVTSTNTYPGTLDATFYQDPSSLGWSKVEYQAPQDLPSISTLPIPLYDRRSESQEARAHEQRRIPSTIVRTRQPRRLTTKEDANFQCHVKGCGKLFGRSYNFKAHMETHDTSREYPFPCPLKDCNKKFVRKTDLQRHHQSVHMKQRNHRCDFCSRFFARKDTLRRHMEDGCSKRFDIETVDFRPQTFTNGDPNQRHNPRPSTTMLPRLPAYNPSAAQFAIQPGNAPNQIQHDASLTSGSASYMERQHDYMTANTGQNPVWSN